MYKKSHQALGTHLAQAYLHHAPATHIRAFLTGCIQPDKNPTTYLKGSLRQNWMKGHNFSNSRRYMSRLIRRLSRQRQWNMLDYYALGKLLHYTADAFTGAHTPQFQGNLFTHRAYEKQLHRQILDLLFSPVLPHFPCHRELICTISSHHRHYRNLPMDPATDARYCIGISRMVMKVLTSQQAANSKKHPVCSR